MENARVIYEVISYLAYTVRLFTNSERWIVAVAVLWSDLQDFFPSCRNKLPEPAGDGDLTPTGIDSELDTATKQQDTSFSTIQCQLEVEQNNQQFLLAA